MKDKIKTKNNLKFWAIKIPLLLVIVGLAWVAIALIITLLFGTLEDTPLLVKFFFLGGGGYFSILYTNRILNKVLKKYK
ncbi:hypothetical protein L6250_02980 [Candidatus Parcubacteria bacterium]|nr:hypothetical protein [Candidatus Parcubacteria bacterium]